MSLARWIVQLRCGKGRPLCKVTVGALALPMAMPPGDQLLFSLLRMAERGIPWPYQTPDTLFQMIVCRSQRGNAGTHQTRNRLPAHGHAAHGAGEVVTARRSVP